MRYARSLIALVAILALVACNSLNGATKPYVIGPDPQAGQGFRFIGHVSGDFDGQGFAYANPITALVKAHGEMMVTIRAFPPPFLVLDGNGNLIVEPLPGREQEAIQAILNGEILIRRNGIAGALNPMGSISAYKASFTRPSSPAPASSAPPAPPPPQPAAPATEPKTTGSLPPPSPAFESVTVATVPDDLHSDGCSGPGTVCGLPTPPR
jgi:hypothetical protein